MDERTFWKEVLRWQNYFLLWWVSWPIAGLFGLLLYLAIVRKDPPFAFLLALMILWGTGWSRIVKRLCSLPCPACGLPAIRSPYFILRYAKCQHCGLAYHKDA